MFPPGCEPPECTSNEDCDPGELCIDAFVCVDLPPPPSCTDILPSLYAKTVLLEDPAEGFLAAAPAGPGRIAVLAEGPPRPVRVLEVDWDAAATSVVSTLDVPATTTSLHAADVDGDGDGDLVLVLAGAPAAVRIAHGDGAGTFTLAPVQLVAPFDLPEGELPWFDAADLVPGGGDEVVVGRIGDARPLALSGAAGPDFLWSPKPSSPALETFALVRFDEDERFDLVATLPDPGPAVVFPSGSVEVFDERSVPLAAPKSVEVEGRQRIASIVAHYTGIRAPVSVWPFAGDTVTTFFPASFGFEGIDGIAGDYATGLAGIGADDSDPALAVAWGGDGVAVLRLDALVARIDSTEAYLEFGMPPRTVVPFDGQASGRPADLAIVRDTAPGTILLVRH